MRRKVQDSIILYSGVITFSKSHFHSYANKILSEYWGGSMIGQAWRLSYWGGSSLKVYRSLRLCPLRHHLSMPLTVDRKMLVKTPRGNQDRSQQPFPLALNSA